MPVIDGFKVDVDNEKLSSNIQDNLKMNAIRIIDKVLQTASGLANISKELRMQQKMIEEIQSNMISSDGIVRWAAAPLLYPRIHIYVH